MPEHARNFFVNAKSSLAVITTVIGIAAIAGFYFWSSDFRGQEKSRSAETAPAADAVESVDLTAEQVSSVKIAAMGMRRFNQDREALGSIDFNQTRLVQVFPPYQGRIISAVPNAGDEVVKDQVLFTIESPDLLQAESTLISAAGVLALQNRNLARQASLVKFGGAAQRDLEQATSDQQTAEGALRAARDALRIFGKSYDEIDAIISARKADSSLIVHSPISGTVTARSAAPGLFVQPGTAPAPFTVADTSTMWMLANISEADSPIYHVGDPVQVKVGAFPDRMFDGVILALGASIDPSTRRFAVRSEIQDPQHLLRAGMFATFKIEVAPPIDALAIAESGVVREGDGTLSAWTTKDRRHFVKQTIKIGLQQAGYDQVLSGLADQELVVTDGAVFLSNKLYGGATD